MTLESWLVYLLLVTVATATPGPAVLFVVNISTGYGWRTALFSALGNISGLFCLGIVAVAGLGTILKTSAFVFGCFKYAGAVYLIYLGVRLLLRREQAGPGTEAAKARIGISPRRVFCQALGVALSNPKAIMFLTALFPQFLQVDLPLVPQFFRLIVTLMAFSFLFLMLYALAAHKACAWLQGAGRKTLVNRASGSVFVGFGVLLAGSSNS